jgi:hypothetical protein
MPFTILPIMFAVKHPTTAEPVLVIYRELGFRPLKSPQALDGWAQIYNSQPDPVRRSAIGASMFGWDVPAAKPAIEHMERVIQQLRQAPVQS